MELILTDSVPSIIFLASKRQNLLPNIKNKGAVMTLSISEQRADYSRQRLTQLKTELNDLSELKNVPELTIFGAGSYARLEASEFSDIDMFFLTTAKKGADKEPRTNSIRMFGKIIESAEKMGFPKFSNDCEYLSVINAEEIRENLGSRTDDHANYFTVRLLLLLESHCLYGEDVFQKVTESIVQSYFKDFPDHQDTFQPIFLLNDIGRYWKTILLNYENKRVQNPKGDDSEERKTKQKVKNFKLKFSRMTTCFASIAALGSYSASITQRAVVDITKLTPRDRLKFVAERNPQVHSEVQSILDQYDWFLEMTGLNTEGLEDHFSNKVKRIEMFQKANKYGDAMFDLIRAIDETNPASRLIRYLVI